MADDQVKYSDLIVEDDAINNLLKDLDKVKGKIAEVKQEAAGLSRELGSVSTATREHQQATAQQASAAENLRRRTRELADEQSHLETALEQARKKYKKLNDEELQSIMALRQALKGESQDQINAAKAIDIQAKSYNELYQTYNALKDALNQMTVAERENSEAGKVMVNRAKEIRDTLNNLQQATGNYTLNVGNYMSAMSGLQMQTQQILREIPSAQNLSQFFLAISNNIPMFTDAMARYNKTLPEIKAKLAAVTAEIARQEELMAGLNVESTEYAAKQAQINELKRQENQLQSASVSGWKAVLKSVGSWQTLLIAGLLLLRKIPDIIKWISEKWDRWRNGVREVKNEMTAVAAIARMQADVIQKTADEVTELKLIAERLKDVQQGTEEWAAGVATVNEITKANLDTTKATPAEVDKVTDAYIRQARQLAKNAILTDMIAKSDANLSKREVAYHPGDYGTARQTLGLEIDSKDEKEFNRLFTAMNQAIRDYNNKVRKKVWKNVRDAAGNMTMKRVEEAEGEAGTNRRKEMNDAIQDYRNFINKRLEILSPDAIAKLEAQYEIIDPLGAKGDGNKPKEPKEANTSSRYWEAQEALLRQQYEGYQLEQQLAKLNHDKALAEQQSWYDDQKAALAENLKNNFITQEKYDAEIVELDRQNDALRKGIERQYWVDLRTLRMKNLADRKKEWEQNAKDAEKAAKDEAKAQYKALADGWQEERAKLVERGAKKKELIQAEIDAEIARLQTMLTVQRSLNGEIMTDEEKAKIEEWIRLLNQLKASGNFNLINAGQIFGNGGANIGKKQKGNYTSISDILWPDLDSDQTSALNSVFDQAKEALNGWMQAKVDAANQSKELADDEVTAAENALNREIELRNQGYANDVALKERELADAKKRQKQAAELQQKAKKDQLAVNTAMEASSMAVAVANLFKDFPLYAAIPLTAVLLGAFAAAKVQSFQAINSTKYREGGVMLLEGGSHQSGHDVNLGIGPDGSNLRAEGGEYFAVINKRNSRRYGSEIPNIVNALNSGMFEDRYIKTSDAMGMLPRIIKADDGSTVDLSAVESGVGALVKQGERTWSTEGEYRVMRYKNLTRRVRVS